jgi:putative two-component system response regulator
MDACVENPPCTAAALGTVLIVDDAPENLCVLGDLLRTAGYRVKVANSGRAALRHAVQHSPPDLMLLDVMMPEMDGYEVLRCLRETPAACDIPVIFVTALLDPRDEEHGLALGAVDFVTKPFVPSVILARVRAQIEAQRARAWLRDENAFLEAEVSRRLGENLRIQHVAIRALACLAETRDTETGDHISRTQAYVRTLATQLQGHPRFATFLTDRNVELLEKSAPLHDIGKVGIPDHILLKPGPLTPDEWEVMKTHAKLGSDAIERAERDVGGTADFLSFAKEIAHWHHEKWNGSGYPDGLAGDAIPVAARLMALADVFDALISKRVYKAAMSFDEARGIIVADRGRHFDPDVADAFAATFDAFVAVAQRCRENG